MKTAICDDAGNITGIGTLRDKAVTTAYLQQFIFREFVSDWAGKQGSIPIVFAGFPGADNGLDVHDRFFLLVSASLFPSPKENSRQRPQGYNRERLYCPLILLQNASPKELSSGHTAIRTTAKGVSTGDNTGNVTGIGTLRDKTVTAVYFQ